MKATRSALTASALSLALALGLASGLSALGGLACTPKGEKPPMPAGDSSGDSGAQGQAESAGLGSGLMNGASLMAIGSMLEHMGEPGIYDAPQKSEDFSDSKPHLLTMGLQGQIAELETVSMFGGSEGTPLRQLQERLREFAADDNVAGLLLRVEDLGIGMAAAQELRATLLAFKKEGARKLYCHSEGSTNITYYLLTACDTIALAPTGQLGINGVAAMPLHLKGLLDKLGIKADFLHVGDYKGAAEPLTLDQPSEAMTETLGAILDQNYATLVDGIAQGRGLDADTVRSLIDIAMFNGEQAIAAKLIDQEIGYESFRTQVAGGMPWKQIGLEDKVEPGIPELMKMLGLQPRERASGDHIAVVYAVGNIIDGEGEGMVGASGEIASRTMIATLRALAAADSVKAVVLRVDSGGGSALASELIWHAVEEIKAKKPVVVSMGGVAASGGYYISSGADRIFADETTLTGSIGVVGGKLAIGGALEKLGVKSFPMGRGKRSMMWSTMGAWNQDERDAVQAMMEDIYKVFVQRVAAGRGKSYEQIHTIAQGRVWTGKAALANGLVDEIGGLDAAIAHATKLAQLESTGELEVYPPEPTLMDYVHKYSTGVSMGQTQLLAEVKLLLGADAASVLEKTLAQVHSFRDTAVQTTTILPVVWR